MSDKSEAGPDWQKEAERVLGLDQRAESTGTSQVHAILRPYVPRVAAALAQMYGQGYGRGSATYQKPEPCIRCGHTHAHAHWCRNA
jgi:hypothetical protein